MKKLCDAVDRFCLTHPRFGIPNLMRYVVGITAVVCVVNIREVLSMLETRIGKFLKKKKS